MSEHEGASIWSWRTADGLERGFSYEISRRITPLTEEMIEYVNLCGAATVPYADIERFARTRAAAPKQCPAQHPVVVLEVRVRHRSHRKALAVFPNLDGSPWSFIPVRMYLCPVCQAVYRERELEPLTTPTPEVNSAAAR